MKKLRTLHANWHLVLAVDYALVSRFAFEPFAARRIMIRAINLVRFMVLFCNNLRVPRAMPPRIRIYFAPVRQSHHTIHRVAARHIKQVVIVTRLLECGDRRFTNIKVHAFYQWVVAWHVSQPNWNDEFLRQR